MMKLEESLPSSDFTEIPQDAYQESFILQKSSVTVSDRLDGHWMSSRVRIGCYYFNGRSFINFTVMGIFLTILSVPCFLMGPKSEASTQHFDSVVKIRAAGIVLISLGILLLIAGVVGMVYFRRRFERTTKEHSAYFLPPHNDHRNERTRSVQQELRTPETQC